jgi:hypothetical protein
VHFGLAGIGVTNVANVLFDLVAPADFEILTAFRTIDLQNALLAAALSADQGVLGRTKPLTLALIAYNALHRLPVKLLSKICFYITFEAYRTTETQRGLPAATETVASNQSGETLDCGFKQAAGRWQQAVSNPDVFSFRAFIACCLLPSACFSPIIFSKGDQNRFLEAKESRLSSTEAAEKDSVSVGSVTLW